MRIPKNRIPGRKRSKKREKKEKKGLTGSGRCGIILLAPRKKPTTVGSEGSARAVLENDTGSKRERDSQFAESIARLRNQS